MYQVYFKTPVKHNGVYYDPGKPVLMADADYDSLSIKAVRAEPFDEGQKDLRDLVFREADELGITYHPNISAERLRERIEEYKRNTGGGANGSAEEPQGQIGGI